MRPRERLNLVLIMADNGGCHEGGPQEVYDIEADRTEPNNLAGESSVGPMGP